MAQYLISECKIRRAELETARSTVETWLFYAFKNASLLCSTAMVSRVKSIRVTYFPSIEAQPSSKQTQQQPWNRPTRIRRDNQTARSNQEDKLRSRKGEVVEGPDKERGIAGCQEIMRERRALRGRSFQRATVGKTTPPRKLKSTFHQLLDKRCPPLVVNGESSC
jgi:hypothetical protein